MDKTLITLGGNLEQPRLSKPSDYSSVGPSGPAGEAKGAGQLVKQTENQEGPRHVRDDGENTPSNWGKDYGFTIGVSKGEGGEPATSVKCDWAVSFDTGQISPPIEKESY